MRLLSAKEVCNIVSSSANFGEDGMYGRRVASDSKSGANAPPLQPMAGTRKIHLEGFSDPQTTPLYAILSHRWGGHEVEFEDILEPSVFSTAIPNRISYTRTDEPPSGPWLKKLGNRLSNGGNGKGSNEENPTSSGSKPIQLKDIKKIYRCCRQARSDGFDFVWIDTCCIDKRSSTELSESINSMFAWYRDAAVCYVYLHDVHCKNDAPDFYESFRKSEWFTRGWTLQELIAPLNVKFFNSHWEEIGTKATLADIIAGVTRIDRSVLLCEHSEEVSVAKKMSWASKRRTTKEEDRAYSLMGLFGVHMPIIYGEGKNAFKRLQHEIIKYSSDHTIFAWRRQFAPLHQPSGLLASSPDDFAKSAEFSPIPHHEFSKLFGVPRFDPAFAITNHGVRIQLPIKAVSPKPEDAKKVPGAPVSIHRNRARAQQFMAYLACRGPSWGSPGDPPIDDCIVTLLFHRRVTGQYVRMRTHTLFFVIPSRREELLTLLHQENKLVPSAEEFAYIEAEHDQPTLFRVVPLPQLPKHIYAFTFCLDENRLRAFEINDVKLATTYPQANLLQDNTRYRFKLELTRRAMTASSGGVYGCLVFRCCTQHKVPRGFAVVVGIHDIHVWSDIIPVQGEDSEPLSVFMSYWEYSSTPKSLRRQRGDARWDRKTQVSLPLEDTEVKVAIRKGTGVGQRTADRTRQVEYEVLITAANRE